MNQKDILRKNTRDGAMCGGIIGLMCAIPSMLLAGIIISNNQHFTARMCVETMSISVTVAGVAGVFLGSIIGALDSIF